VECPGSASTTDPHGSQETAEPPPGIAGSSFPRHRDAGGHCHKTRCQMTARPPGTGARSK
jgi:hypothetical protein